jgi:hypothetical protein
MNRRVVVVLLSVGLVTQGCGIAVNALRSNGSPGALNTFGDGRRIISVTCISTNCVSVARVEKVTDLETWAFTYKEKQVGPYGIPAGEVPITQYYVGDKSICDAREAAVKQLREVAQKNSGVGKDPIVESCHGPYYFETDR